MLRDILTLNIFAFFVVFARVGTTLMLLPGYSTAYVSPRIRLAFALTVSFVMMPTVGEAVPEPPSSVADLAILMTGEVVVGAFFGTLARILIAALQTAGTFIALFASIANAFVQDPIAEQQSSTVSGLLTVIGLTLVFATGTDRLMLQAVADSYTLFVPGQPPAIGDFSDTTAHYVSQSFRLGLQLSAPFLVLAMVYYIGLGLLGRLMPQLQVFFFGMPAQIGMQLWLLMVAVSGMLMVFMTHFREAFLGFLGQ